MHKISFLLSSLLIIVTISVKAQIISPEGKWKFKELYNSTKDAEIAKKLLGDFSIYLKGNNRYSIVLMAQEEGVWSYNTKTRKIQTTSDKGSENAIQVISITDSTLIINFDKTGGIILRKADADSTYNIATLPKKPDLQTLQKTRYVKNGS